MNWNLATALVVATSLGAVTVAKAQPIQYPAIPDCQDTGGNHLNFTLSTLLFSCGTSGGGVTGPDGSIQSNVTGSTNPLTPNSLSSVLDHDIGSTPGDFVARGASSWKQVFPEHGWVLSWSSVTTVAAATYPVVVALRGPTNDVSALVVIDSVDSITGGSSSPGFTAAVVNNGTTLTGCSAISVGTVESTSTCSAGNTVALGSAVNVVISNIAGTPEAAGVQINYHWIW